MRRTAKSVMRITTMPSTAMTVTRQITPQQFAPYVTTFAFSVGVLIELYTLATLSFVPLLLLE